MPQTCSTFALGISLDADGDLVVIAVAGLLDEEEAVATIPFTPNSAVHIAHQMAVLAAEAYALEVRMEGMTVDEKRAEVEKILAANEADKN